MDFLKTDHSESIEIYKVINHQKTISYQQFFINLKSDINFRSSFINLLKKSKFKSYRFETPSVNSSKTEQPFELVLVNAPELNDLQDPVPFEEHMDKSSKNIISFLNLSKSSELIIPNIKSNKNVYSHLANFVRNAPIPQVHELFKVVRTKVLNSISTQNIWVSTAGAGVDWLHVRIDKKPKYYRYKNYKI